MFVYYSLAAIAIWLGVLSLRGGLRFSSYVRQELARPAGSYLPFVSVIAPFRGADPDFCENIAALLAQNYPAYEIIFVTDRADDPGLLVVERALSNKLQPVADAHKNPARVGDDLASTDNNLKLAGQTTRIIIAGPAIESGQKVYNLQRAVQELDQRTEVIAFVDSDARPHRNWLRALVSPLSEESVGAATGYRWFEPQRTLASHLRSVWNASIASALGASADQNFCWGGSTAMRRETFEGLGVARLWRGSISDDFTMTRVLQKAKLAIHFVPACLVQSFGDCSLRELLGFTNRQLKITRVYAPHLWQAVLLGSSQFVLVFFGGIVLVVTRLFMGLPVGVAVGMLAIMFGLGTAKAWIRLRAVRRAHFNNSLSGRPSALAHLCLWPFASALFLINALTAAFSRRIYWRGISYELKSPTEAVIISRDSD